MVSLTVTLHLFVVGDVLIGASLLHVSSSNVSSTPLDQQIKLKYETMKNNLSISVNVAH